MPFANRPNARIHYTLDGAGDPLLLIMGLGGHAVDWSESFVAELAQHYAVIRMDNRGVGYSECDVASWTLSDMAEDAREVLDALGLDSAHVLGISMGGMIAQHLVLAHPSRVRKLILMATHFGGRETVPPEPRGQALFSAYQDPSVAEARRRSLRAITAEGFADEHPDVIEDMARLRESMPTPLDVYRAQYRAIVGDDRSQSVHNIERPTLVLHGQLDPLVPVQNGVMLAARIPGAKLCLLDNCGHMPFLEKTEQTASAVLEFLAHG
jgi:3-oxoadipate enol-lactonase